MMGIPFSALRSRTVRVIGVFLVILIGLVSINVGVVDAQPEPGQEEFVPMDEVPPEDQLPAAPLLVTAYVIIWFLVIGYLWLLWRRMSKMEREVGDLSRIISSDRKKGR